MTRLDFAEFANYPIATTTASRAVDFIIRSAQSGHPEAFRFVNAGTIDAARSDPRYRQSLATYGVNFPDGAPLAAVIRIKSSKSFPCEQVRGPWLFEEVVSRGRDVGLRHFLLGTTDDTLGLLTSELRRRFPGTQIVGHEAPPFREMTQSDIDAQDQRLVDAKPDIVWVALGTPRQDREGERITQKLGLTTAAVGAAFDFTAGTKRSSPTSFTRLHLEWLFRLASEPRRLWRRYTVGNAYFLALAARHLVKSNGARKL